MSTTVNDTQEAQEGTDNTYNPAYVLVALDLNEEVTLGDDGSVEAHITVTANNLTSEQVVALLEDTVAELKNNPDTLQDATVVL